MSQTQTQEPTPPAAEGAAAAQRRDEQEAERVKAAEAAAKVLPGIVPLSTPADKQTAVDRDREAAEKAAVEYGKQSQAQHEAHQRELREARGDEREPKDPIEVLCQAFESLPMSIGPDVRALLGQARKASAASQPPPSGDETNPDLRGAKTAREEKTQGQAHRSEPDRSGPDQHRGKDT